MTAVDTYGSHAIGTWERLGEGFSTLCPVTHRDASSITIGTGAKTIRLVRLEVSEPSLRGSALVSIRVELVRRVQLEPASVLRVNADMAVGSIGLRDGMYELCHAVDLVSLTWARLDMLLGYLGQLGAAIRGDVLSPAIGEGDVSCFAHFAG